MAQPWVQAHELATEEIEAAVKAFSKPSYEAVWKALDQAALAYIRQSALPRINEGRQRNGLTFAPEPAATVHLLNAIREDIFNEIALPHRFFTELLDVYEAGHLPCGWEGGRWPEGSLVVW